MKISELAQNLLDALNKEMLHGQNSHIMKHLFFEIDFLTGTEAFRTGLEVLSKSGDLE